AHLQTELSDGLARLREQAASQSLDGTTVSAAIFAHLQTARSERLTAVPTPASTRPEAASLKRAVREIEAQQSQADVLKALLRGAVDFADRVALFVVKNDQAIGWRLAKADDPDLEMIGGVSLALTAQTIVTRAARDRITTSGADAVDSDYAMLLDQLGGAPAVVTAMPLIVRGKVVAVLYADSSSTDTNAMNVDALDLLTRVAAMAVNLVTIQRAATAPAATETMEAGTPQTEPASSEPAYTPQIEAPVADEPAEVTAGFDQSIDADGGAAEVDAVAPQIEAEDRGAVEAEVSSPTEAQTPVQESPWAEAARPAFA